MTSATRKGLTFIELFIVIIIVGILAAVAIPRFKRAFESLESENFAKNAYALAQYLQNNAIVNKKIHYLNIDKNTGELGASLLDNAVMTPLLGRFAKKLKAPQGTLITTEPDVEFICFYPDGNIDNVALIFTDNRNKKITLKTKGVNSELQIR